MAIVAPSVTNPVRDLYGQSWLVYQWALANGDSGGPMDAAAYLDQINRSASQT